MEHTNEGHRVIETAVYESSHTKSIEDFKSKADNKRSCFQKYVDFIDEQKERVSNVQKQCTDDINKAYEESVRQLTEKKEVLISEVNGRTKGVKKELDEMKKSAQEHITHLTTIADVVTNRTKIPSDTDALSAHDTLCQDLQEAFKQEDPDYKQSRQSSRKGKSVSFMRNVGMDELVLGKIVNAVARNIALPPRSEFQLKPVGNWYQLKPVSQLVPVETSRFNWFLIWKLKQRYLGPVDLPVQIPVDLPVDLPVQIPVDLPVDLPVQLPVDLPVQLPVDLPVDFSDDYPVINQLIIINDHY